MSVSTMADCKSEVLPDDKKTAFDWCRDGSLAALKKLVTKENVDNKDEIGRVPYSECS